MVFQINSSSVSNDLFFGKLISVNMNRLYQRELNSSILFNLALKLFLLFILNSEINSGYCLKVRRFNSDLQSSAPKSVKWLAYTNNILIFINSKEEFLELQERLKVHNSASNSQVSCSKSVVFPLLGGSTSNNQELKKRIANNNLRLFDS